MSEYSNNTNKFDSSYYDEKYFAISGGKKFKKADGTESSWSYANPQAEWLGCSPIVNVWKKIFKLDEKSKVLDVGCGRGTFVGYLRDIGIETWGFDFSKWAVEHVYHKCEPGWIVLHDATQPFPYGGCPFDLVLALDIFEHLYNDGDIDKAINEIYRVTKKWVFLQIAVCGSGGLQGDNKGGYILKKGEVVSVELEGCTVAGHVTVQNKQFWVDKLLKDESGNERKWKIRDDMLSDFINKVPADVISNWIKNTMIILEKV